MADFINELIAFKIFKDLNNITKKLKIKDIIVCLLLSIISAALIISVKSSLNFFIKLFFVMIAFKVLTKNSLAKSLITISIIYIALAMCEMLFALVALGFIHIDSNAISNEPSMIIISNILIILLCIFFFRIPIIFNFSKDIVKWYYEKYTSNSIVILLITMFPIYFFLIKNINYKMNTVDYIINAIVIACIAIFIIIFFKQNEDKNKIKNQYDNLIDYAKTYEQEVVEKSKWQHEYQNQLIIVKSKISKTNKEAQKYIDNLLKNQPVDINSQWLSKLSKFPDIGIKGLICYKIGQMQAKGINVFVDVSEELNLKKKHCKLLEENLQDISRVLGVYLDNAIDAASKTLKKYIVLEINADKDKLVFEISNTFTGSLNFEKIDNEKFTTKGKGHGYGLSLVKDILSKNNLLSQEREINGMYYVQKLIIDIKK